MITLGVLNDSSHLTLLLGTVMLKARSTVIVLAKTVDTATVNRIPKVICCRRHLAVLGCPMKSNEQRKQSVREMSRM